MQTNPSWLIWFKILTQLTQLWMTLAMHFGQCVQSGVTVAHVQIGIWLSRDGQQKQRIKMEDAGQLVGPLDVKKKKIKKLGWKALPF